MLAFTMDPLSITGSVIALLHVSRKVIDLISTIASASAEIRCLTVEISTTRALLSSISDIAGVDETWNNSLRELMTTDGPMQMLDTLLSKLEHRLGREVGIKGELGQLRKMLIWPWRADDTREMVRIAREARGLLAGALAVDHLWVLFLDTYLDILQSFYSRLQPHNLNQHLVIPDLFFEFC